MNINHENWLFVKMAQNRFFNNLINSYRNVPLGMVYQIYLGNSFHPQLNFHE